MEPGVWVDSGWRQWKKMQIQYGRKVENGEDGDLGAFQKHIEVAVIMSQEEKLLERFKTRS